MTTIAYRDGIMAGDSRATQGGTVMTNTQKKVFRTKDGCLFGYAGDREQGERLKQAIKAGKAAPKLDNINALLVTPDGKMRFYEGQVWVEMKDPYTATGSGAPHALTAMDCGLGAVDAVRKACLRDPNSGGKVQSVELKR